MKAIRAALLGTTLQLAACASLHNDVAPVRDAWLGASYEEVVARWGSPARSTTFNDGRFVFTWHSQGAVPRTAVWPAIGVSAGSGSGFGIGVGVSAGASRDVAVVCERTLIFQGGRVIEQTWHGPTDFCSTFRRG